MQVTPQITEQLTNLCWRRTEQFHRLLTVLARGIFTLVLVRLKFQGLSFVPAPSRALGGTWQYVHMVICFWKFWKGRFITISISSPTLPLSAPSFFGGWHWRNHGNLGDMRMKRLSLELIYFGFNAMYLYGLQSLLLVVSNPHGCIAITPWILPPLPSLTNPDCDNKIQD